ncbi:MAG: chalcone isomerase family protein, partial [Nonlabens sp.]
MKKLLLAVMALLGTYTATAQQTIEGVSIEKNLTVSGQELSLNGAGVRQKLWFELYVGALYTTTKSSNGSTLV